MRVYSISDLHVDYDQNMRWVLNLPDNKFSEDILIVAGDISDDEEKFKKALAAVQSKFREVFFVPGNHDLWVRKDNRMDSLEKFYRLINICAALDIRTERMVFDGERTLIIQPIFSWYERPEEGEGSLYFEKRGEDPSLSMWMDTVAIRWPGFDDTTTAQDFFGDYTRRQLAPLYAGDLLTFSHFLPRAELIFPADYIPGKKYPHYRDPAPKFNFSSVAGSKKIDAQLRSIGSHYHIHGHQHRNRFRDIDGVHYISHNLGYPKERKFAGIMDNAYFPKLIWDGSKGFIIYKEQ